MNVFLKNASKLSRLRMGGDTMHYFYVGHCMRKGDLLRIVSHNRAERELELGPVHKEGG